MAKSLKPTSPEVLTLIAMPFDELLNWHLSVAGTRPDGDPATKGRPWVKSEFANSIDVSSRLVEDYQAGNLLPDLKTFLRIEQALFAENLRFDQWRTDLRHAFDRARRRSTGDIKYDILEEWLLDDRASSVMIFASPVESGPRADLRNWIESIIPNTKRLVPWQGSCLQLTPDSAILADLSSLSETLTRLVGSTDDLPHLSLGERVKRKLLRASDTRKRFVLLIDGVEEDVKTFIRTSILPAALAPSLRIVLSLRRQFPSTDMPEWLKPYAATDFMIMNGMVAGRPQAFDRVASGEKSVGPRGGLTGNIPSPQPAAIEPKWLDGRLVRSKPRAVLANPGFDIKSAMIALKADWTAFADRLEGNVDYRVQVRLREFAEELPAGRPSRPQVFQLHHKLKFFRSYRKIVAAEWPSHLASEYDALTAQLFAYLRQFPVLTEFKAKVAKSRQSAKDLEEGKRLGELLAKVLQDELAQEFVDQAIPQTMAVMAQQLLAPEAAAEILDEGNQQLAADLLTSMNNVLKVMARPLLVLGKKSGVIGSEFLKGAEASAKKEAKKAGEKVGAGLIKWTVRVGSAIGAYAGLTLFEALIANFPLEFGWLRQLIDLAAKLAFTL